MGSAWYMKQNHRARLLRSAPTTKTYTLIMRFKCRSRALFPLGRNAAKLNIDIKQRSSSILWRNASSCIPTLFLFLLLLYSLLISLLLRTRFLTVNAFASNSTVMSFLQIAEQNRLINKWILPVTYSTALVSRLKTINKKVAFYF